MPATKPAGKWPWKINRIFIYILNFIYIFVETFMELFKNLTVLSLEQATVAPYLTYRLAQDGMSVIRLEHPV